MIQQFVDRFMKNKDSIRAGFKSEFPGNYTDIVEAVVIALQDEDDYSYGNPDPDRIHEIDDGHYQGTLLYVVGAEGYQPDTYWATKVGYGSCSGCDTLDGIESDCEWDDDCNKIISENQLDELMTLALHIVQGFKEI